MWLICEYCKKEYRTYTAPRCKHHYCSRECSDKAGTVEFECDFCGKRVIRKLSQYKTAKKHFCSISCANKWQGRNKKKYICKTCGKIFYRSPSWNKQKKGRYCSIECRTKDPEWIKNAVIKGNYIQCRKKGLNRLEQKGNIILDKLKLEYETQYLINDKMCVDVYIPKYNLIIQWDGDYWHGKDKPYNELEERVKKRVDRDRSQDAYLKTCGYNELRFWESEVIKREDVVYETIKRTIRQIAG